MTATSKPDIDKNFLYGRYQKAEDDRLKLAKKMAHKALDIPEENMNIDASRRGIGALGVAAIASGAGLPAALIAGLLMLRSPSAPTPPVTEPTNKTSVDKLRLRAKWKADGNNNWTPVPEVLPAESK